MSDQSRFANITNSIPFPGFAAGPHTCVVAAPAKVNLFLELTTKRPDGYHDLATLMSTIDLYDTLEVRLDPSGEISLNCDTPGIPTGPGNLVYKAALALQQATGTRLGCRIRLMKRIPSEAGLGGGSSDAAATLAACNAIWNLHLTTKELTPVAATIGSDVAFFLHGGVAWCTGRGEIVVPLKVSHQFHLVVVKPAIGLSTAEVYKHADLPTVQQDGTAIRAAMIAGDATAIAASLFNRLQAPAFGLQPTVATVYDRLVSCGPLGCLLSGSGSSVFAICRDREDAARVARAFVAHCPANVVQPAVFIVRSPSSDFD